MQIDKDGRMKCLDLQTPGKKSSLRWWSTIKQGVAQGEWLKIGDLQSGAFSRDIHLGFEIQYDTAAELEEAKYTMSYQTNQGLSLVGTDESIDVSRDAAHMVQSNIEAQYEKQWSDTITVDCPDTGNV